MQLQNKTALITGAGAKGGIGAAIASLFAREGAHVVVSGRDAQRGEQAVAEITSAGGNARFVLADLSDLGDVARLAQEAGDVDVLVNNAAVFPFGPTVEQDATSYDEVFATNVRAPYFLTAALAPKMLAKGSGSHQHQHHGRHVRPPRAVRIRGHQGRARVAHARLGRRILTCRRARQRDLSRSHAQ